MVEQLSTKQIHASWQYSYSYKQAKIWLRVLLTMFLSSVLNI